MDPDRPHPHVSAALTRAHMLCLLEIKSCKRKAKMLVILMPEKQNRTKL